jgi:SAM-dependent methyltransferase
MKKILGKIMQKMRQYYISQVFNPSPISILFNPVYLSNKTLADAIRRYSKKLNGKLLDYGCGSKPYRHLFDHISQYIGVDIENEGHDHSKEEIDFFYDGIILPFRDEEFDCIFSTEVLEHVPNIHASLLEINRVLKIDGSLLLTVPFVYPEHEIPNDFRRYTVYGIKQILKESGFEIIACEKIGSFYDVLTQLFVLYFFRLLGGGGGGVGVYFFFFKFFFTN